MKNNNASPWPTGFGRRPWLIQAHGGRKEAQTLVDFQDRRLHEVIIPEMQGKICLGCVHDGGWLLMLDEDTHDCFMLSLTDRRSKICLPPLRLTSEYSGTCGVLGSPANFTVVIASHPESEENSLLCCRPGDAEWTDLLASDGGVKISGDIVACAGKLYASTFTDDLVVIDLVDGVVQTQLLRTEQEKELRGSYATYLVVSCGDIFSVRIDQLGSHHYDGAVTRIVVYRLDFSEPDSDHPSTWRRVQGIGSDRAFLVSGDYGVSCSATRARLQGNCVYLVWSSCDCERIYKFCLDDMTVAFDQILPQPITPRSRAYWVVPCSIRATELKEQALVNTLPNQVTPPQYLDTNPEEEQRGNSTSSWPDLPLELLETIVSNLSLVERLRFPAVCKSWGKVSNPVEEAKVWPWLMHLSKQDGACKMFDPLHGKEYTLRVEALKTNSDQLVLRSSMDGWVVVSTGGDGDHILIINPLTQEIVEPPTLMRPYYRFRGITFSSAPTSPYCMAFGICSSANGNYVTMETWMHGEDEWDRLGVEADEPFPVANNNPVYFRGEFYCLGRKGNLGVYNPYDNTWRVLDKPEPIFAVQNVFDEDHEGAKFCYLVELEGCLISVFVPNANEPPRVFKLDDTKMAWIQVEDIGGAALFLDYRASFGVVSPGAGNGNRIFLPRCSYDGKHAAFYDMDSKKYLPAFYGLKEQLNCVWVVPCLI